MFKKDNDGSNPSQLAVITFDNNGIAHIVRRIENFFEKNNLQYDPEDFDFTPYGRHIEQSAHARHHSSSDTVHRSPGSVSSPTSSFNNPALHPADYKSEFLGISFKL